MSYRYIGNKSRLVPTLLELIAERTPPGGTVADLMCGTATVASALRANRYRVFASDIMTFAYLHARVRLTYGRPPAFRHFGGYNETLRILNELRPAHGYFAREYSPAGDPLEPVPARKYFTSENAGRLDSISRTVRQWRAEGALTRREHELLLHDLVLAANRVANIAGTYGHFRSKWSPSSLAPLKLVETEFVEGLPISHVVAKGSAEVVSRRVEADLCYLDPPYTKRQYAANYHILETIARGDEPHAVGVSGLRPWRDQYSDFCSKLRVRDSFRKIITNLRCPRLLVSYSEEGLLARDELESVLCEFGDVKVIELRIKRFRSQRRAPARPNITEYVFDLSRH